MYNLHLVFIGIIMFVLAYLVGVKKMTWLLSGYNQHRVRDKDKLAKIVGTYNFIAGVLFIAASFLDNPNTEVLVPILVLGYVILIIFVQKTMVE